MDAAPSPWQIALARIEGALPFLSPELAEVLAMRSLRRLWAVHVRDFPFDGMGLEHNPGINAAELMRSWYADERRDFLSWIARKGPHPLAAAAREAMAAKGLTERFTAAYDDAEIALTRLDALLPSSDSAATIMHLVEQLRSEEVAFLEGGTEVHAFEGRVFDRAAPKGAAWAASLALAVRPQLFALGAAQLALAGLAPRMVFRAEPDAPLPALLREALQASVGDLLSDLEASRRRLWLGEERLASLYASSRARDAWRLVIGLGPLTRAEIARGLGVTKRTASQVAAALVEAKLITVRQGDAALVASVP